MLQHLDWYIQQRRLLSSTFRCIITSGLIQTLIQERSRMFLFKIFVELSKSLKHFFSNVPDAELYTAAIRDLKVYNETALLKCGSIAQRKHIVRMFNGIPSEWYCTLSVVDRLVVVLAHKRMWFILDLYIRIGFFLKQLFR